MGSNLNKNSQQDGLEDGEWRVPLSEGEKDKGNSTREYHAQRYRSSSHQNPSSTIHRRQRDYHYRGIGGGSYRGRDMDQRRGPVPLPPNRSSGPLTMGRRGPPLSARGTQVSNMDDTRGRDPPHTYSRPRFSMNPYHGSRDPGSRYPSYKVRDYDFSPRSRDVDRDVTRTPFSSTEYQESMSKKAAAADVEDKAKEEEPKKVNEPALKRLGTVDILKSIKDLEDKKEGMTKEITESETELSMLKASLPKLIKAVEKVSQKAPVPPKSPTSLDISEESMSEADSDTDDSLVEASRSRGNRSKQVKAQSLKKNIESLAPEQRRLVSALGNSLRVECQKSQQSYIASQNADIRGKVEQRFQRLYPAGYDANKENTTAQIKAQLDSVFQNNANPSTGVYKVLRKDHVAVLREHVLSGIRYRFAFEKWREDALPISSPVHHTSIPSALDAHANEPVSPMSRSMSRGRNRGVVRSDLEERIAIATLQAVESVKSMTTLPSQTLFTERSARWIKHYYDWNRLLKNPSKEFEKDDIIRPWSKREKDVFAEKFLVYHKDFARIASYLPSRTIPEVIKYYYAVQRSQEFEVTRRKWQLRKRREKAEESALQRTGTASSMGSLPGAAIGLHLASNTNSNVTEGGTKALQVNPQMEGTSAIHTGPKKKKTKRKKANVSRKHENSEDMMTYSSYFDVFPEFTGRRARCHRKPVDLNSLNGCIVFDLKHDVHSWQGIAPRAPLSFSTSNLEEMNNYPIQTKANSKPGKPKTERKKKPRRPSGEDTKSVGRGRLPSVDTDKKYIEAVQIYGKDFPRIASYMNKTVEAARKYWERHNKRLGLASLLQSDEDSPEDLLDYSTWATVLGAIPEDSNALDDSLLRSIPSKQWEHAVCVLDHVPHVLNSEHISSVLVPELCQGIFARHDEIVKFVTVIKEYFATDTFQGTKKRQRDRPVWSDEDKKALVDAFEKHGKNWEKLQESVPSKTLTQVKNFYQNYKYKHFNEAAGPSEEKGKAGDSPTAMLKKQKTGNDSVPEISIPQEMLNSLPQGILEQMEKVMTNPTARMQFNALVMMQQQASAQGSTIQDDHQIMTSSKEETDQKTDN